MALLHLGGRTVEHITDDAGLAELDEQLPDRLRRRYSARQFAEYLGLAMVAFKKRQMRGRIPAPDGYEHDRHVWYFASMYRYKLRMDTVQKNNDWPGRLGDNQRQLMVRLIDNGGFLIVMNKAKTTQSCSVYEVYPDGELKTVNRLTWLRLLNMRLIAYDGPYKSAGDMYKPVKLTPRQLRTIRTRVRFGRLKSDQP